MIPSEELSGIETEISKLECENKIIRDRLYSLYNQRAILSCPYKIGQIMESKRMEGYGRTKKEITRTCRIIKIRSNSYAPYYCLIGINLKKDGTEGESRELYHYQSWKPKEESNADPF